MIAGSDIDQLNERGAGRPAPIDVARLYQQAFREFGAQALWSRRASAAPTIAQALFTHLGARPAGHDEGVPHWPVLKLSPGGAGRAAVSAATNSS